jgi:hypothetical protein
MFPVSFQVERDDVHRYGFHVELDRVRNLPGAPDHETVDFVISFDPRGANLPLGPIETVVPINVCFKCGQFHTLNEIGDNVLYIHILAGY